MADKFASSADSLTSPLTGGFAVTPSDSVDMTRTSRCLWVGGGGNIAIVLAGSGEVVTLTNVPSGSMLPIRATRVNLTNTTATSIVALD